MPNCYFVHTKHEGGEEIYRIFGTIRRTG